MAGQKTVPTSTDIESSIAAIAGERRRADAQTLVDLMGRITGQPPTDVKKLADIDLNVLEELMRMSIATIEGMYPCK